MADFSGFNLSNMFRVNRAPQASPQQQQPQGQMPGNQQQQPQQQGPNNGPGSSMQLQNNQNTQGAQNSAGSNESVSPLDRFSHVWKTPANTEGNPSADPFSQPLFSSDPAKIREAAGQIDFLQAVPQELMQKAMSGNDPQSFMQVLNAVAQNAVATALQVSTQTVEQAGSRIGERFNKALPARFKDLQINSAQPTNPILTHPAVQPMLTMVRNQIKMTNPDLSPTEINQMAEEYLTQFGTTLTGGNKQQQETPQGEENFDWMSWASQSAKLG